jgi:hypothetical protein
MCNVLINPGNNTVHCRELFKLNLSEVIECKDFPKTPEGVIFLVSIEMRHSMFLGPYSDQATFV